MIEAGWLQDGYAYSDGFVYDMYTKYLIYLMGHSSEETENRSSDVRVVTPDSNAPSASASASNSNAPSASASASGTNAPSASASASDSNASSASDSASATDATPSDDDELECVNCCEVIDRLVCTESCNHVCVLLMFAEDS